MKRIKKINREVTETRYFVGRVLCVLSLALYSAGIFCYCYAIYAWKTAIMLIFVAPLFLSLAIVALSFGTLLAMGKKVEENGSA